MSSALKVTIASLDEAIKDVLVVLIGKDGKIGPEAVQRLGKAAATRIAGVAAAEAFTGKFGTSISLPAEAGFGEKLAHVVLLGVDTAESQKSDFLKLGGQIQAKLPKSRPASLLALGPDGAIAPEAVADLALGMKLAAYRFDRYQTQKKGDDAETSGPAAITILAENAAAARRALKTSDAVFSGVTLARDLVNEPPNILTPIEFANRAAQLEKLGVEIDILDEKALKKLGMRALLGVGHGSEQESRFVIMKWFGAKDEKAPPLAFVGKGVVFDTGGISIKPAQGMEDMKGDMAGAAAVVGLMHTLAARKAKANVIGAIGLVENREALSRS